MITLARDTRPSASQREAERQRARRWAQQKLALAMRAGADADEIRQLRAEIARLS